MPYCAYWGHEISGVAARCPNCGPPVQTPIVPPPAAPGAGVGELAGFWIRLGSLIIDGILVALVTLPFGVSRRTGSGYVFYFNPARNLVQFVYAWLMLAL